MPENNFKKFHRIEPLVQSDQFQRSLRCEIRDPLWMLTRQWQMGEFKAEDNGTPAFASIQWKTKQLESIQLGEQPYLPFQHELPMEALVERVAAPLDLHTSIALGKRWLKLLQLNFPDQKIWVEKYKEIAALQFELPKQTSLSDQYNNASVLINDAYISTLQTAIFGRLINGALLIILLQKNKASNIIQENNADLDALGLTFLQHFRKKYNQPTDPTSNAWQEDRLEYQFKTATTPAKDAAESNALIADEFYHGQLDWYAFDRHSSTANVQIEKQESSKEHQKTLIPTPIKYPGMPKARWWEMEDYQINFGGLNAKTTEVSKLAFAEFGLIYSNDWLVIPLEVTSGKLLDLKEIIVTDVFGQQRKIKHYKERDQQINRFWNFFGLDQPNATANHPLFIPAVTSEIMEGVPQEQVNFIRDELANMAWGIEKWIPDLLGGKESGREASDQLQTYYLQLQEQFKSNQKDQLSDNLHPNESKIKYQLANTVPENWIPFIPVQIPAKHNKNQNQNHFQRAAMPRLLEGFPPKRIRPKSHLLSNGLTENTKKPYFIYEEEIPRSGVIVKGSWQRSRWYNGQVVLWYGYRKIMGRGEGNSGLSFDKVIPKNDR